MTALTRGRLAFLIAAPAFPCVCRRGAGRGRIIFYHGFVDGLQDRSAGTTVGVGARYVIMDGEIRESANVFQCRRAHQH